MELTKDVLQALSQPFDEGQVEFLPRGFSNGKARALPYIDARGVMVRLDDVVGPAHWSFDFDPLSGDGKLVRGRLTVCGVTKCDAGQANDEDEALKSAVSDALKRCAVHFGIGRYLYHLPAVWAPYDKDKRRWAEMPRLQPNAVADALRVCGVTVQRTAPPQRPPARAPESSGDRAAAQKVQATEQHGTYGTAAGARTADEEAQAKALRDTLTTLYRASRHYDDSLPRDEKATAFWAFLSNAIGREVHTYDTVTSEEFGIVIGWLQQEQKGAAA